MQPWETYRADLSIDLGKHHVPKTFLDRFAFRTVKLLRIPTDIFFQVFYFYVFLVLIWSCMRNDTSIILFFFLICLVLVKYTTVANSFLLIKTKARLV